MDPDYRALAASDGAGEAVRATVESPGRSIGSTTIPVNATTNWPSGTFIATTGTLLSNGKLDPATVQVFYGTASGTNITITQFAAGYSDLGNSTGDIVVIKPSTEWANIVAAQVNPVGVILPFAGSSAPANWLLCDGSSVLRSAYANLYSVIGTTFGSVDGTHFNLPDMRGRTPVGVGTGQTVATFASRSSNVITVTGIDNTTNNGFQTGQAVTYHSTSGVMTGLTNDTVYYVIRTGNLTFSLASSLANAVAGTAISLSSDGSGTQTFTDTLTARALGNKGGEEAHAVTTGEMPAHTHPIGTLFTLASGSGATALGGGSSNNSSSTGGSGAHNNMQPFLALNYIIKT